MAPTEVAGYVIDPRCLTHLHTLAWKCVVKHRRITAQLLSRPRREGQTPEEHQAFLHSVQNTQNLRVFTLREVESAMVAAGLQDVLAERRREFEERDGALS